MNKDQFIQSLCPTLPVSVERPISRPEKPGTRFWVANNGLWVEISRPWMYLLQPVATRNEALTPFGAINTPILELPRLPRAVMEEFVEAAREACPNEIGCWVFWNPETREARLVRYEQKTSTDAIQYDRPASLPGESLVWDIHSHGRYDAYFSPTDNKDDFGDTKIAIVIGNMDKTEYSLTARFISREITIPLNG